MVSLPIELVIRIADLLGDIAKMRPGFEIYEAAKKLTKDLNDTLASQLRDQ